MHLPFRPLRDIELRYRVVELPLRQCPRTGAAVVRGVRFRFDVERESVECTRTDSADDYNQNVKLYTTVMRGIDELDQAVSNEIVTVAQWLIG
jgi:hypothetical protein